MNYNDFILKQGILAKYNCAGGYKYEIVGSELIVAVEYHLKKGIKTEVFKFDI